MITNPEALPITPEIEKQFIKELKQYVRDVILAKMAAQQNKK